MEITEIIKKAIIYPTTNGKGYLLFGILIVLANLKFFTSSMQEHNIFIIGIICSLITFIFYCVMSGYDIFVIKEGIDKSNKFPTFNFIKQFVTGIKSIILAVVYFIIPLVIAIILAFLMKLPQKINELYTFFQSTIETTSANGTIYPINPTVYPALPNANEIFTTIGIFILITIILLIIFGVFYVIAKCRLAKFDSFKSAINIPEIIEDIRKIGVAKFVFTYLIMIIIAFAIIFISGIIISSITSLLMGISVYQIYIAALVSFLFVNPFLYLFQSQTVGLLYSETE